jgi:hypothetical protein
MLKTHDFAPGESGVACSFAGMVLANSRVFFLRTEIFALRHFAFPNFDFTFSISRSERAILITRFEKSVSAQASAKERATLVRPASVGAEFW